MAQGIYANSFSEVFSKLLEKGHITCYQLHQFTDLDQAYLSRLKNGEKFNPSPEALMNIALGLVHHSKEISRYDIDEMFESVGRSILIRRSPQ
jgi:transcriptional regulator with XRE-family HTH domain